MKTTLASWPDHLVHDIAIQQEQLSFSAVGHAARKVAHSIASDVRRAEAKLLSSLSLIAVLKGQ